MSNRIEKSTIEISDYAQSISKGGTSGMTVAQASVNLGYVRNTALGANGGIAKTNNLGKLPAGVLTEYEITGNQNTIGPVTTAFGGIVNKYVITNYSSFTPYTVATTNGTVSVAGDVISYTPLNVDGLGGFTVNGELFTVTVSKTEVVDPEQPIPVVVAKPVIISPVNASTNLSNKVVITSSAFTMVSGTDTHEASHWQISTSPVFTTILYESVDDTVNKTSWASGVLSVATKYYMRVRYKGAASGYGTWSSMVYATTKASFLPSSEVQKFYEPGTTGNSSGDRFTERLKLSRDGLTAVVGRDNRIWVFIKTQNGWVDQARLLPVAEADRDILYFGKSVDISDDGNTIIVGCSGYRENIFFHFGSVFVFKRVDGTWSQVAVLVSNDGVFTSTITGHSVSLSGDGNTILAGAPGRSNNTGGAYIFKWNGAAWSQVTQIVGNDSVSGDQFGSYVKLSKDGTKAIIAPALDPNKIGVVYAFDIAANSATQKQKFGAANGHVSDGFGTVVDISSDNSTLIIGAPNANASTTLLNHGIVEAYILAGNGTWSYVSKITGSDTTSGSKFGSSVSITEDKSTSLIGAPGVSSSRGAAYTFTRAVNTWTQKSKLVASDGLSGDRFGATSVIASDGLSGLIGARDAPFTNDDHNDSEVGALYVFN